MKNLRWFLSLVLSLTFLAWGTTKVLAANNYNQNSNFGYYVPAWERGQVLGETITNCQPFDSQYCQSPGVVGKDANGCNTCLANQGKQNQPPQNNFPPCPSGQVYLCGNANPGPNMVCPSGGQPTCGVLANNQQYQPRAEMCQDNTALVCVGSNGKISSPTQGPDGKLVCPVGFTAKCGDYQQDNYQGQNNKPAEMMRLEQGREDNFKQGLSDEEMTKEQARRDIQQLKNMQRDVKNVTQGLKQPKALIVKAKKARLTIPQGLTDAISGVENYITTVKNAKTMVDLENLDSNPGDFFSEISDYMGLLSRQIEFPKMLAQAKKNFKTYQTAYTRLAKNKKIDTTDLKKAIDETVTALAQIESNAKTATDSDSFEAVLIALGDVYDVNFDNIRMEQQQAEFFVNYKKGLTSLTSMIKSFTNAIKRAEQKKLDADLIATAKEQLAQVQQLFNEVKTAANVKPVDTEDLMTKVSDLTDMANELNNTLGDLGVAVNNIPLPQMLQQAQQPKNNFQMPSSFNYGPQQPQGNQIDSNNQGGSNQGPQMAPGTF